MKKLLFLLACTFLYTQVHTQITNSQINYELRVDQWRQSCDNDALSADDNEVRIGLTSDGNTGGTATWTSGGNGATCTGNNYVRRWQDDAPSTVTNTNTLLYYCVNRANNADFFTINHESWEEDGAADCSSGGDACTSSGTWAYTFKSAAKTSNRWWGSNGTLNGAFVTGQSGDFFAKTVWRYTYGDVCTTPLLFGTLSNGVTYTHTNSNRATPGGASATMGYSNISGNAAPDVFYQFTIANPSTVTISTNNAGTNFDTYLRLYSGSGCATQIAFNDDNGGSTSSTIAITLCPGTYTAQVEGFSSNNGDFVLSVVANTITASGGVISGITDGLSICSGTDPGAFTGTAATGAPTLSYQWEISTTSASSGFSDISGQTGQNYDPASLTQTTWFRRRVTDACGTVSYSNVVQVILNASSTPLTAIAGAGVTTVCPNTNTTLTASGGIAGSGSVINWYTGPNGTGTLAGTGTSISVSPAASTTYYARREGACNTTADVSYTLNVKTYIYAANGTTTNTYCTDNAGWNHFYVGDNIVYSCKGNFSGAPAGFPSVTIYNNGTYYQMAQGPNPASACASNLPPGEERFEMSRSWNLDFGGGTSIPPYDVRFYYQPAERTAIETAAINWMSSYSACGYSYKYPMPNGFYWFKNTSGNYSPAQYDGVHLTGTIASTPNAINYAELTGITSFSGGSAAVILVPISVLPVEVSSFASSCDETTNNIHLYWTTMSEHNSSHFQVERSTDGTDWSSIGTVNAAGNSENILNYHLIDANLGRNSMVYYRLKQFDLDGTVSTYDPISESCNNDWNSFEIFPNPASSQVNIAIKALFGEEEQVFIQLHDVNGRLVKEVPVAPESGKLIHIDLSDLVSGIYSVRWRTAKNQSEPIRLIKNY